MFNTDVTNHFILKDLIEALHCSRDKIIDDNGVWVFDEFLAQQGAQKHLSPYMHLLTRHHLLCAFLNHTENMTEDERVSCAIAGLMLTQLLDEVYKNALDEDEMHHAEIHSVRHAKAVYEKYLKVQPNLTFRDKQTSQDAPDASGDAYEHVMRSWTKYLDFFRLLFIRMRRVLLFSVALLAEYEAYGYCIAALDNVLRVAAFYQALVLLPRFMSNMAYLWEHVDSLTALGQHLVAGDRWWEVAYDFGWLLALGLSLFVFVGPLLPLVAYIPVVSPAYNFFLHAARLILADLRLAEAEASFTGDRNSAEGKAFLACLDERRENNRNMLYLRIAIHFTLITAGGMIALYPTSPVLIFAAAVMTVLATLAGKWGAAEFKQEDKLSDLGKQRFFSASNDAAYEDDSSEDEVSAAGMAM